MVVRKEFNDIECMIDDAVSIDANEGVSFVTKYDNATLILKELFGYEQLMPYFIRLTEPSWDGYDREFIISVNNNGEVFCEKYYRNGKYINGDGIIFILPDCCEECVAHLHNTCYEYNILVDVSFADDTDSECGGLCGTKCDAVFVDELCDSLKIKPYIHWYLSHILK